MLVFNGRRKAFPLLQRALSAHMVTRIEFKAKRPFCRPGRQKFSDTTKKKAGKGRNGEQLTKNRNNTHTDRRTNFLLLSQLNREKASFRSLSFSLFFFFFGYQLFLPGFPVL